MRLCLSLITTLLLAGPMHATQRKSVDPTPFVHVLHFSTLLDSHHCTGTAIGPHAILTASHCEAASDDVLIDATNYVIVDIERDSFDHTILLLNGGKPFAHYASVDQGARKRGDTAIIVGFPGTALALYRAGQYSGSMPDHDNPKIPSLMFSMPSAQGDSGAGIFDVDGTLYAVESFLLNEGDTEMPMWLAGAYPLHFSKAQLSLAADFTPTTLVISLK